MVLKRKEFKMNYQKETVVKDESLDQSWSQHALALALGRAIWRGSA